ncbi:MerR family transcriptional regulator [Niallia endozanthoxylica]|uniref:MerR family transcriptional regulator n=1 Tax=Niallia endozanthoxylica TaxID=2036016 RepID=A0A5J5H1C4_9BACI|nr:MerR family transcriptional regulator [Niallia endozanthoxylica]KAA9014057.1 MerR family transcriptional regulator [Niallia endozanthoxylica]
MNNRQLTRAYSIKEVSQILNTPNGTIRQWEKDLNGLLKIPRTQQGARYYTENEIKILNKVKEMREQNVPKGMIRSLLEKYLNQESEPDSESFETNIQPLPEQPIQPVPHNELQPSNLESLQQAMELFKQDLLNEIKHEIKHEMKLSKNDIIDDMKNEISHSSLVTVKEISKSIQRSNDKRKAEVQEISNAIVRASEKTSETFGTLSYDILKGSESTYERIAKRINATAKMTERDNQKLLENVSKKVDEARDEMKSVSQFFDVQQDYLIDSINELKQSQEEIQKREEIFQEMISSYREVAAAKKQQKKWWKPWS